ncbi:hypothetical protein WJX72_003056 [[Myrmecia] bisecta]|uniref:Uncharacterized protein n=1 Tax=[Myrmecia] bisecta TaxID=41462 RepID=A0AAW1Q0P3_9CHLO
MGIDSTFTAPRRTDFVVVVNGDLCAPCQAVMPHVTEEHSVAGLIDLQSARSGETITLLQRSLNQGMDFAAHNTTLTWLQHIGRFRRYKYFIFLNSSVRGPFFPSFMPPQWHWTRGYTDQLRGELKLVGASLVCLPTIDHGGHGPKIESWTFAVEPHTLRLLTEAGVFSVRTEKFGMGGVVIAGEYGLSNLLMRRGVAASLVICAACCCCAF